MLFPAIKIHEIAEDPPKNFNVGNVIYVESKTTSESNGWGLNSLEHKIWYGQYHPVPKKFNYENGIEH